MGLASCCTTFECQEHTATLERQLAEAQDGWGKATAAALQLDEALAEARKAAAISETREFRWMAMVDVLQRAFDSASDKLAEAQKNTWTDAAGKRGGGDEQDTTRT